MDTCLAATGSSVGVPIALIVVAVALGLLTIKVRSSARYLVIIGITLIMGVSSPVARALTAQDCPAVSSPDTSNGVQGAAQTYSVLGNDTPSLGATFVLTSLTLGLPANAIEGSVVSGDAKIVTVPGEGVYVANGDGTITFTPDAAFVGTARGVVYTIRDTASITTTSTYAPIVQSGVAVCLNQSAQVATLENRSLLLYQYPSDGSTYTVSLLRPNTGFTGIATSSDGSRVLVGGDYPRVSTDGGVTWSAAHSVGYSQSGFSGTAAMSADGSVMVVNSDHGTYVTSDAGVSWRSVPGTDLVYTQNIAVSGDGSHIIIPTQDTLFVSSDRGETWSQVASPVGTAIPVSMASSFDGSSIIITTVNQEAIRSSDGGMTWAIIDTSSLTASSVGISPDGSTALMYRVVRLGETGTEGMYRSIDGGVTWTLAVDAAALPLVSATTINISSDNQSVLYTTFDGLATSTDGGSSYTLVATKGIYYQSTMTSNLATIYTISNDDLLTIGPRIEVSRDGGSTWSYLQTPRQPVQSNLIDIDLSRDGLQTSLDRTVAEGWHATYNQVTDTYTLIVDNATLFSEMGGMSARLQYSLYSEGCTQPMAATIFVKLSAPY